MPAVPAADHFAILNQTLAEWESQMGAKILDSMDSAFPLKQCNANAISFYTQSESLRHKLAEARNPHPIVHGRDDILRSLNFARPS